MKKIDALFLLLFFIKIGTAQNLTFCLEEISNDGTHYVFNINVQADVSGTFHSRGMVYLDYDTVAFGSNIQTNTDITITALNLINDTFKYEIINIADNSPNTLAITWGLKHRNQTPSNTYHTEVPTTPTGLFQISIPILNSSVPIDISFHQNLMLGQQFQLSAANTEIAYDGNMYIYNSCSVLPIELLTFNAHLSSKNTVDLHWTTASETNSSHFEIERSIDTKNWENLGKVVGAGTTNVQQTYDFEDKKPYSGLNYYRLKQVNLNREFEYSEIVNVFIEPSALADDLQISPNPASNHISVVMDVDKIENYQASLWNSQGILIQQFYLREDWNGQIEIEDLMKGIYFLQIQNESSFYAGKFIKN